MKFRLMIYTLSGRLDTDPVPVPRGDVKQRLRRWTRTHETERIAFALLLGAGSPGLNSIYGVAIPRQTALPTFTIKTVASVQLALTPTTAAP